ncbi:MAG: tetratricopeptide repeat protein [Planctomycetes bacterium]|nr:tetratricopeptide repeat protein [Planctomycetota bacterium]
MAASERVHAAVHAVVRHAIRRGWLTGEQLREALLLQEQLRAAGRPTELLPLLRGRFIRPEHVPELTQVYRETVGPQQGETLPLAARDVPRELLDRSSELLRRPRDEDPPRVREFLRASGEGAPSTTGSFAAPARVGGYRVVRELARGGMGVVYHAHSMALDRPVALKVMRDALAADAEDVERFLLEARAAARLRHPGIVGVHEVGQDEGRWFIAMDLVEGESLKARVQRAGPLPGPEAARVALGVARALAYAHERSILHRDVKPANVLLAADGAPLLTDFGLAKDVAREDRGLTATGVAVGTPAYMPPEQALGDLPLVDRRADVYGLGATLYEMLTGRAPFRGPTALAVLEEVVRRAPARPSALRPGLDLDLETICLTCLEKEPARRYADAAALAADLEAYLEHRPIQARPVGPLGRAARWARRNPWVAASLAAATFVALLGGVGGWAWRAGLERARAEEAARRRALLDEALVGVEAGGPGRPLVEAAARVGAELTDEVLGARLVALARDLRAVVAEAYRAAAAPDAAERAAGAAEIAGVAAAADAWTRGAPRSDEEARALREAEERLTRRAARGRGGAPAPSFAEQMALAQARALGGRLRAAGATCEALARAGGGAAVDALEAYLDALYDPEHAVPAARALCEVGGPRGHEAVVRALRRLGERSPFAGPLRRALEQARVQLALRGDGAAAHVERARARLELGDEEGALADASRAVELEPERAAAWVVRARARHAARDREGALGDARRAVTLDPSSEEAWLTLGGALRATRDLPGALEALDRAVALAPTSAWALRARAQARLAAGDAAGARQDADAAVELAPRDPGVRVGRAVVREGLGDLTGALDDLAAALEVDPEHATALSHRGAIRLRMRRPEEAFADLTRAIELAPGKRLVAGAALANRALLRHDRGDLEGALQDVEAALRLDSSLGRAYLVRASVRVARQDLDGAREDLDRALRHDPDDPDALANRGSLRAHAGDVAGALADLDRAVELRPRSFVARVQRGKVRLRRGDLDGARADLEEATRIEGRAPEAWRLLAEVHERRGDAGARASCLAQARALARDDVETVLELVEERAQRGDWAGAERQLDAALAREETARLRLLRGKVRLAQRRAAAAREDFDRAAALDPGSAEAWVGRSLARRLEGDPLGGDADLRTAAATSSEPAALWELRAEWRLELGDYVGALEDVDRALALGGEPPRPRLLLVRGAALQTLGHLEEAAREYERFLAVTPDAPEADHVRQVLRKFREASPAR